MSRSVCARLRLVAALAFIPAFAPGLASAQTTVVLDAPEQEVTDTTLRGGSFANATHDDEVLATRASGDPEYIRRALIKFDTENRIPRGAHIQSARLRVTVRGGNSGTRPVGIYRVEQSFQAPEATWNDRASGARWQDRGGDLGSRYALSNVPSSAGSQVTFDVTRLVQETVNGDFGSRYTRMALVDTGSATRESYREYYPSEASTPAQRPVLTVVYGGSGTSAPAPAAPADTSSSSTLKLLHWNIHHGVGTDGRYDIDRIAAQIARTGADVVSLNEVEKNSASYGNEDQAAEIARLLTAQTGRRWYQYMRVGSGASRGVGNAVLSRFPIASSSYCQLSSTRNAVHATISVNGRNVNVFSTHLAVESASWRLSEIVALAACMLSTAQQKIVAGDFNAQASSSEIGRMVAGHFDAWARARSMGATTNYAGNCDGCTRNSRIDYIFSSTGATSLALQSARIFDSRDSRGYMPSDHKPMLATYTVR